MRILLLSLLLCVSFATMSAQSYFSKVVMGPQLDFLARTILTGQSDLVTVGSYKEDSTTFGTNIFIQKMDTLGNLQWTFVYNGGDYDRVYDVVELPDGNLLLAGLSDSLAGNLKGLLMKVDMNGNILWSKTYLPPSTQTSFSSRFSKVITTSDSAIVVTGIYSSGSSSSILMLKTDLDGNVLWENNTIMSGYARPQGLIESSPGEYSICVQVSNSVSYSTVITYDDMGGVLSALDLRDNYLNLDAWGMAQAGNGEKIVCGEFGVFPFLARLDANDSLLWLKYYGSSIDPFHSVESLGNGNFVAFNEYFSQGDEGHSIMQFDALGEPVSYYWVDSDERFRDQSLWVGADGSLYLGAELESFDPTGKPESLVIRTSLTGAGHCPSAEVNLSSTTFGLSYPGNYASGYNSSVVNSLAMTTSIPQVSTTDLCVPVGREELLEHAFGLTVSPNPTSGWINLSLAQPFERGRVEVDLFDVQGRVLQQLTLRPGESQLRIALSEYVSGVYWLRVSRNGELLAVEKVLR